MSPYALLSCDNFSNFYKCILFYCISLYCTSQILWSFYFYKLKFVQPFIEQNYCHCFPKLFTHFMSLCYVSVILLIFHAYVYPTKNHLNYKANPNSHERGNDNHTREVGTLTLNFHQWMNHPFRRLIRKHKLYITH